MPAHAEHWAAQVEGRMPRGGSSTCEAERTTLGEALDRYRREVSARKRWGEKERYIAAAMERYPLKDRAFACVGGADIANFLW